MSFYISKERKRLYLVLKKESKSSAFFEQEAEVEVAPLATKKAKKTPAVDEDETPGKGSASGGPWVLEELRQVRHGEFRGRKWVDIREHFEKDGQFLPSKKGISLSAQQWKKLIEVAKEISRAVEN